jgi:hypothetical protein
MRRLWTSALKLLSSLEAGAVVTTSFIGCAVGYVSDSQRKTRGRGGTLQSGGGDL